MNAILIRLTVARFVLRIARCFAELIAPEIRSPSQRSKTQPVTPIVTPTPNKKRHRNVHSCK